jgi:hypothetical protein
MSEAADWTFGGSWPYEPRWYDTAEGRLHYVDEAPGDGLPVVLDHLRNAPSGSGSGGS